MNSDGTPLCCVVERVEGGLPDALEGESIADVQYDVSSLDGTVAPPPPRPAGDRCSLVSRDGRCR